MGTRRRVAAWIALAWGLLWSGAAGAQDRSPPAAVALPDGRLVPGTTNTVEVAALGTVDAPNVSSSVGPVRLLEAVSTGVWRYAVPVPVGAREVEVSVGVGARSWNFALPTWTPPESSLELPRRVEGLVRGGPVRFEVRGERLPPPDALQVVVSEGRVTGVAKGEGALIVEVQPDDSPFPRHVAVGVRDRRADERPTWTTVRLRSRPVLPLESEPGSTVTVTLGDRTYGPLTFGPEGRVDIRVDQYPEELVAVAVFTDDLGNQTRQEIPLARQAQTQLVPFPSGDIVPGERAPVLYLAGIQGNGYPWRGADPACRSAAADLEVQELSRGRWMVALPGARSEDPEDLRVDCDLGGGEATARLRVPVARGLPARLGLRVWPRELRTDFPFAEVRVVLEDHRGDRLDVDGVTLGAEFGTVTVQNQGRTEIEAEYDGSSTVERPEDRVLATWTAPPGSGVADVVRVGWETVPSEGTVEVVARVLDLERRPLQGIEVELAAGGSAGTALTDSAGLARTTLALPEGRGPVVLEASAFGRRSQAVAIRGLPGRSLGSADLTATADLELTPGRVAGLSVQVDPAILRAAPGAVAWVYVDVEDRVGNPVADEAVSLSASEGRIGSLRARPDGTLVAEYVPEPSDRPRSVEITAEVATLRSSARLEIAPRPVRFTLGAWGGVQTNFGSVLAPVVGVDGDLRVRSRLTGESLMLRVGLSRYQFARDVSTGAGPQASLASAVYPVTLAALLRQDRGRFGLWGGAGGMVAVQTLDVGFGSQQIDRGVRALGGPALVGGAGVRLFGGEALATVQASWLPVDAGDAGFSGNIGGLASGLGYRLVF